MGARSTAYQSSTSTTVIARSMVGMPSGECVRSRGTRTGTKYGTSGAIVPISSGAIGSGVRTNGRAAAM